MICWVQEKFMLTNINNCHQSSWLYNYGWKRMGNLYVRKFSVFGILDMGVSINLVVQLENDSNKSISLMHVGPICSRTNKHFKGFSFYTGRKSYKPNTLIYF